MSLTFRNPCGTYRAALVDFVDQRALGSATAAALSHLDRCRACEEELSGIALAIAALRRVHREVDGEEPAADAWLRLRARVQRRSDPWHWRATLGGLAGSMMLVAVLVGPIALGGRDLDRTTLSPWLLRETRVEAGYLAAIQAGDLPPTPRTWRGSGSIPRNYPEEIREIRKEVLAARPINRPPEAIRS
jgi:hypothetical protein